MPSEWTDLGHRIDELATLIGIDGQDIRENLESRARGPSTCFEPWLTSLGEYGLDVGVTVSIETAS